MQSLRSCAVACILAFLAAVTCTAAASQVHYRGGSWDRSNVSQEVHVQLTDLKLTHFSHRGSLHVDRIELRSEDNGRNGFYVHNPTDPRYPLWAAARASVNSVWPKPAEEARNLRRIFEFNEKFTIRFAGARDEVMSQAAQRCSQHLFKSVMAVSDWKIANTIGSIGVMEISVRNTNFMRYPHLGMREDYELVISNTGITLVAQENWGVVRGLETVAQLIFVTRDQPSKFFIQENRISDKPAYQHRGLMIDTARHFIRKSTILENLEAMSMNKMNVFHWHIVDDQSFAFLGSRFPILAMKSAYPGSSYFYSVSDIQEIVEFARVRGIRVIPEFDTPDHTHSWGHGMPNIMSWCKIDGLAYTGPLNPITEDTFQFLREFFTEVAHLFPDSHLHLGMDEVSTDCWRLNGSFGNFMREKGMINYEQLVAYYSNRLTEIIGQIPKKKQVIVWEDILSKDSPEMALRLPPDTIVQVWITRDPARVAEWAKKYRIIHSEEWYLDQQTYGADWVKRYRYSVGDALGGEACMWTEYQSDQTVTPHTWPSVSAVAERLWSGQLASDVVQAAPRIEEQNCRMQARGIRVGVAGGPGMCQAPVARYQPPWRTDIDDSAAMSLNQLVHVSVDGGACWLHTFACAAMAAYLIYKSELWRNLLPGRCARPPGSTPSPARLSIWRLCSAAISKPAGLIYMFLFVYFLCWLALVWLRD